MKRTTGWLLAPQTHLLICVLLLGYVVGLSWWLMWGGPEPYSFFDLNYYRTAVLTVIDGSKSMYEAMAYPPFAYLLLWWLANTPPVLAAQLWAVASLILLIAMAAVLTAKAMDVRGQDWHTARWELASRTALATLMLCVSMPVYSQITCGQLSLLVIALPLFDLAGVLPKRFGGILVGLAAAIKVTPMIFSIYYLVTGQYRKAANAGGAFVVFTAIGAIFFPAQTWEYWTRLGSTGQDIDPLLSDNWGIRSMLARISPALAQPTWLWAGLGLLLMALALWRARVAFRRGDRLEAGLIVAAAAIVVPPNALPHYFTWLPLIGIWLISTARRRGVVVGCAIFAIYSMAWFPLSGLVDAVAPMIGEAMASAVMVVPVLIGVFGLPRRSGCQPATLQAGSLPDAAHVS